jgi:hypothetical protein
MPDYVKTVMKADFELHNALWTLRHATPDEGTEKNARKVTEILKEATERIEKLIKEEKK